MTMLLQKLQDQSEPSTWTFLCKIFSEYTSVMGYFCVSSCRNDSMYTGEAALSCHGTVIHSLQTMLQGINTEDIDVLCLTHLPSSCFNEKLIITLHWHVVTSLSRVVDHNEAKSATHWESELLKNNCELIINSYICVTFLFKTWWWISCHCDQMWLFGSYLVSPPEWSFTSSKMLFTFSF